MILKDNGRKRNTLEDTKKLIQSKATLIEDIIEKYLPAENGEACRVMEAMNYSVHVGGKRLRPMLMQETYKMFGGTGEVIEPFMAAIEMIHTYSLVHDDLPAMDNDEYRRGKKSTHAQFGHAMGILAGDALLNYAFETALKAYDCEPGDKIIKALKVLSNKAGIYGMVGGQVFDVESENLSKQNSLEEILFIHKLKTSALLQIAFMCGGGLAGASSKDIELLSIIGENVGIAFQIKDDILDVIGSEELLGKPVGSDERNNKITYVNLVGLEQAEKDVESYSKLAIDSFDMLSEKNEFMRDLIISLVSREK